MALTLSLATPNEVHEDGGTLIEIAGAFDAYLGQAFEVHMGPNGDETDPTAYTGVPGRPTVFYPLNGEKILAYTPLLPRGTNSVFVKHTASSETGVLTDELEVYPKDFKTSIYDHRKAWAPVMDTGPRSIPEEEPL